MIWPVRDPSFLCSDKFLKAFKHFSCRKLREPELSMGAIHPFEVLVGSEQHHSIIVCDISLESFKAFNAVMKSCICWVEFEGLVSFNEWSLPATVVYIIVNL